LKMQTDKAGCRQKLGQSGAKDQNFEDRAGLGGGGRGRGGVSIYLEPILRFTKLQLQHWRCT
jgi:hypothetical protein